MSLWSRILLQVHWIVCSGIGYQQVQLVIDLNTSQTSTQYSQWWIWTHCRWRLKNWADYRIHWYCWWSQQNPAKATGCALPGWGGDHASKPSISTLILLKLNKQDCAIFLLLGSIISWANGHFVSFSRAATFPKRKQPLQYIFFNWATIFPRKQNKSCGQQYLPQDSKYFFYWATIYPRRKQIFLILGNNISQKAKQIFWAKTFPRRRQLWRETGRKLEAPICDQHTSSGCKFKPHLRAKSI